jgi:uncharacterized protein
MKYLDIVLRYPRTLISAVLLTTLLFAWQVPDIKVDTNIKNMIPQDFPIIQSLDRLEDILGGSEIIVIAVESENLWTVERLEKFAELQGDLEDFDEAQKVLSIYTAKEFEPTEDGFDVTDILSEYPESEESVTALKAKIKDNDLVYGTLVSRDYSKMAFIVQLTKTSEVDDDQFRKKVNSLVNRYRGPEKLYISGLPVTRAQIQVDMQDDLKRFMPYGILLMIILLALSFRSWIGVFLPLIVVIISIVWTFGLLSVLGIRFSFITMLIPVMLIAIANDYGIHIITHYFHQTREAGPGESKEQSIRTVMLKLGAPIFLAGITTIIGFMSLLSHVMTDAKKIGLLASFGILIAFLLSLTLLPAILSMLNKPKVIQQKDYDQLLTRFLQKWTAFFTAYPRAFLLLIVVLLVVVGWKIPDVIVDTDPNHYYQEGNPFRVENEVISEVFGGSTQISVLVEGDIKDPKILNDMLKVSEYLEKQPSISQVVSIADQIARMNEAFHGGKRAFRLIPENRDLVAQFLLLYSMTGDASDLERFVDYDYKHAQILVRINRVSSTEINDLLEEIDAYLTEYQDQKVFTSVTGFGAILGALVDILVRGQIISLIVSIFLVFVVTAIVFRSVQGGIYAILPLTMAIILVFGLMGYLKIELNAATVMLSSIMIGVGIDYTIHFLWHLREELGKTTDLESALEQTMRTSGKGIIFNAFSVIIGFSVLLVSAFLPIEFFGFLIVFSIGMCLFGALAVLPAIVVWLKPKFLFRKQTGN